MIHSVEIIIGKENCGSTSSDEKSSQNSIKKEGGTSKSSDDETDWRNERVLVKVVEDLLSVFQDRYLRFVANSELISYQKLLKEYMRLPYRK